MPHLSHSASRIAIVGVGQVGAAAAFALILQSVTTELLLVDIKTDLRNAQVCDLANVSYTYNSKTRVRAATHQEARQSDIVIITAGSKPSRGETSMQHIYQKVSTIRSIVNEMKPFAPNTILLLVASPVDLLTSIAHKLSGLPQSQVLGSGTFLESARIRYLLGEKLRASANLIDLDVVGVQGKSQVVAWSAATVAGIPVEESHALSPLDCARLSDECERQSTFVYQTKGSTPFGIASVICAICTSILSDKRGVHLLSHFQPEYGCCFSMPVILGRSGIMKKMQTRLSGDERTALENSVQALSAFFRSIDEEPCPPL